MKRVLHERGCPPDRRPRWTQTVLERAALVTEAGATGRAARMGYHWQ